MSLMPKIPSSFIVSKVLTFLASKLMSLGNLSNAEYRTVSYTVSVPINVSSWSTNPTNFLNSLSETSRPLTRMTPPTTPFLRRRARMSRKVDLPAPEAPIIAITWPGFTCPEIFSMIVRGPRVYDILEKCKEAGTCSFMSL